MKRTLITALLAAVLFCTVLSAIAVSYAAPTEEIGFGGTTQGWRTLTEWVWHNKPTKEKFIAERFTVEERHALAKLLWGEARGIPSDTEKAAVIWCVLNRVDSPDPYYPDTILGVVKQRGQFAGYKASHPVDEHLLWLVDDVLYRWATDGEGRVLPSDYLFFASKASEGYAHNYFRKLFNDPGPRWDWSLPSPYES